MGSLTNFLANRKTPGINLDQSNLFEGKPVPTGLALMVPVDQLDEDPDNPRKEFPPETIEELAQDIAQRGILQPIVVCDRNDKGRDRSHQPLSAAPITSRRSMAPTATRSIQSLPLKADTELRCKTV